MTELSTEYKTIAARDEAAQKKAKRRIDAVNAKRGIASPSGVNAPRFDGRGQREIEESRRMDNKRSKEWKGEK